MRLRLAVLAFALLPAAAVAQSQPRHELQAALANIRDGRPAEAAYWLDRLIADPALAGPARAEALQWRASLRAHAGQRQAALADLDAAIKAEPDNPWPLRARARLHLRHGNARAALADLAAILPRIPSDAETLADHCEALAAAGRRAEAVEQCRKALQSDPALPRARRLLRRLGAG
jgi:predicted Zn-dependent protease